MTGARLYYLCCMSLQPRYKKLVAKIFPNDPEIGLIKCKMDKLLRYALSKPDKIQNISENLIQRINRDMYRHYRINYIFLSIEALYQLLLACRSQGIYLFATSYLDIIMKLLDNENIDLQVLATDYFIKFTFLEEDAQTYYEWYEAFVLRFKDMCYCNSITELTKYRMRITGLRGIQGIIRKAINDEQKVVIFENEKMENIVSSLLYNMNDPSSQIQGYSHSEDDSLSVSAQKIFCDLVFNATFGSIKSILKPVLVHFDYHQLWEPNDFAIKAFQVIMNSIQIKYSYLVLQMLVYHMDNYLKSYPAIRTNIIAVIYKNVLIASEACVFPTMLEVFDSLLKHLRISIQSSYEDWKFRELEETFQNTTIKTISEIANRLSSYQKIDAMMFLVEKFPQKETNETLETSQINSKLEKMLLKILHTISPKLRFSVGINAFPPEFLLLLLKMSQNKDSCFRIRVEQILHDLLDKHGHKNTLSTIRLMEKLSHMTLEITSKPDIMFMKRNGYIFYQHIYENMEMETNGIENFEAIYCTMALIASEYGSKDIIVDLYRLALDIQDMVGLSNNLSKENVFAIHSLIAAYLNLLSKLFPIVGISDHIVQVIEKRKHAAEYLLPKFVFNNKSMEKIYPVDFNIDSSWLFSRKEIYEHLQDASSITIETESIRLDSNISLEYCKSTVDDLFTFQYIDAEFENAQDQNLTFQAMKAVLTNETLNSQEDTEKRLHIYRKFKYGAFEEIVQTSKNKLDNFQINLNEALNKFTRTPAIPLSVLNDLDPTYFFENIQIPIAIY